MTDTEDPLRFEMHMKPGFADEYTPDLVLNSPIKWSIGEDVMTTGVIVGWTNQPDGGVTLLVEQRDLGLT